MWPMNQCLYCFTAFPTQSSNVQVLPYKFMIRSVTAKKKKKMVPSIDFCVSKISVAFTRHYNLNSYIRKHLIVVSANSFIGLVPCNHGGV